jgi:hypothetical protein
VNARERFVQHGVGVLSPGYAAVQPICTFPIFALPHGNARRTLWRAINRLSAAIPTAHDG